MASASDQIQTPSISRSTLHRRPVNTSSSSPVAGGSLIPDVDPPPKPPVILQLLAFGLIAFLACLQFLPVTHVRDPNDPRNWILLDPCRTANSREILKSYLVLIWAFLPLQLQSTAVEDWGIW